MESKTGRERRKNKENAQIVFEILEEKGVKAAPKRAKEERWTGKWKEITDIDLSQWEDQTKIDLQDTKDQLYYYQYYDRIYVVKKVIQKEREKTEQEKKTEKIKENKRKITEILKRMRRERDDFIKELVSGKITIPKEVNVKETGWKIMINQIVSGGSVAHMNAVYGFYGIGNVYEAKEEEVERIKKRFCRNEPRKANADPPHTNGRAVRSNRLLWTLQKRNETPKRLLRIAPTDGILVPLTGRAKDPKRDSRIIHTGDRK